MERADFLRLIVEQPDNLEARLSYADWLDERGDPQGEFIRLQCQLKKIGDEFFEWDDVSSYHRAFGTERELHDRVQQLLSQYASVWREPIKKYVGRVYFREGLPQAVTLQAKKFLECADELFASGPIIEVKLRDVKKCFDAIVDFPPLARIQRLELDSNAIGARRAATFFESPYLQDIQWLGLANNSLGRGGIKALIQSNLKLKYLDLRSNRLNDEAIMDLMTWPGLQHVKSLFLDLNQMGDRGAIAIAECPYLKDLLQLRLSSNTDIGDEGRAALLGSNSFPHLTHLDYTGALLAEHVRALADAPFADGLASTEIHVADADAAFELVKSPLLSRLDLLILGRVGQDRSDELVRTLTRSPNAKSLFQLDLSNRELEDETWKELFQSNGMPELRQLTLTQCGITDEHIDLLTDWAVFPQLEDICLSQNKISYTGLKKLFAKRLPQLRSIRLYYNSVETADIVAIIEGADLPRLEHYAPSDPRW